MPELSHFNDEGASRMVDVGHKESTHRLARAEAFVVMEPETLNHIQDAKIAKGDVFAVARLAGIMATKQTDKLIPLCHSLGLDHAEIDFEIVDETTVRIESSISLHGKTGVEMEALTAVSVAALTIYDMCKSIDRTMTINSIQLVEKRVEKEGIS